MKAICFSLCLALACQVREAPPPDLVLLTEHVSILGVSLDAAPTVVAPLAGTDRREQVHRVVRTTDERWIILDNAERLFPFDLVNCRLQSKRPIAIDRFPPLECANAIGIRPNSPMLDVFPIDPRGPVQRMTIDVVTEQILPSPPTDLHEWYFFWGQAPQVRRTGNELETVEPTVKELLPTLKLTLPLRAMQTNQAMLSRITPQMTVMFEPDNSGRGFGSNVFVFDRQASGWVVFLKSEFFFEAAEQTFGHVIAYRRDAYLEPPGPTGTHGLTGKFAILRCGMNEAPLLWEWPDYVGGDILDVVGDRLLFKHDTTVYTCRIERGAITRPERLVSHPAFKSVHWGYWRSERHPVPPPQ